ncbi:transcriptional repressor LexA [Thermoflexus sp.]|uniref:transcriptional repressor LexA n=1 Tax=Thermoflexus sp. TaxID=1969742 RepID=UPI0025F5DA05|nr:transcriptional repressor LexA [Thermoflexus sp.]MDW8181029.1 transcriptional repressor LexA [Anaerolineae bacterium]MCS6964795.1 transcriptional repressor LexA [Thermoflexus sp.]MCS7351571.1 transcriptional repressor LexA [Thermoflexus sp.]MCX7691504.1 transcriptional repressor LexA [Thermoflexus sp.]MDW8185451.1 transcriptional repressor LexA [Anaerolineae bacterium]
MKRGHRSRIRRDLRQEILAFIVRWYQQERTYPTVREIQKGLKISSPSVVDYHLRRLEEEGLIVRVGRRSRGIRLRRWPDGLAPEADLIPIPFLGSIAAGEPIPNPGATPLAWIRIPRLWLVDGNGLFALRVQGNSMVDALVGDGDLIIVKPIPQVEEGEMAVVWLADRHETTLKRVYREGDRIRLQPAHPAMTPLYVPAEVVHIQGKVVQVLRNLNGIPLPGGQYSPSTGREDK